MPAGSYVCSGLVDIAKYGSDRITSDVQTTHFDLELKHGQTVSWVGAGSVTYTAIISDQLITSQSLGLQYAGFGAHPPINQVQLTAYYDSEYYTTIPMLASECRVLNLWDGSQNGDAATFFSTGEPSDPRANGTADETMPPYRWWQSLYDDSGWPSAVAVDPDPLWSQSVPLPSGADYIWDTQKNNPIALDSTNDAEQMLIRWRFTLDDSHHQTTGNVLTAGTGSRDIPRRIPVCSSLGHTDFIQRGNDLFYVNEQQLTVSTYSQWYSFLRVGTNLISILVNDARFLTLPTSECSGGEPWQPWISVPWFGLGLVVHGFSIAVTRQKFLFMGAKFGGTTALAGRSFGQVIS